MADKVFLFVPVLAITLNVYCRMENETKNGRYQRFMRLGHAIQTHGVVWSDSGNKAFKISFWFLFIINCNILQHFQLNYKSADIINYFLNKRVAQCLCKLFLKKIIFSISFWKSNARQSHQIGQSLNEWFLLSFEFYSIWNENIISNFTAGALLWLKCFNKLRQIK